MCAFDSTQSRESTHWLHTFLQPQENLVPWGAQCSLPTKQTAQRFLLLSLHLLIGVSTARLPLS